MKERSPQSREWRINGLRLRGLSWGEQGQQPVLALHGWLDNAASFSVLAPLLIDCHVVALDLTGHGKSDWRSPDASYQIWDDLPEIVGVLDALGWESFNLIGHSRGAIISTLLAAVLNSRVQRLILLDALLPRPLADSMIVEQLRLYLQEKARLQNRGNRIYPSVEAAVASRQKGGLDKGSARLLAQRNLIPHGGGFTWTTDPRLQGASAVKLSEGHIQALLQALDMPVMLLLAEGGYADTHEVQALARRWIRDCVIANVAGGHHFHMDDNAGTAGQRILEFISK